MAFELPPHLKQVLGNFSERASFVEGQMTKVQAEGEALQAATGVIVDRTTKAAEAAQTVAADKSSQAAALEDRLVKLGSSMMPDEVRFANATAIGQAANDYREQLSRVQELESVSFFDNPLAYLVNSVQVPREATKLAQAGQTVELLTAQQQRIAAATSADAQAIRATARTMTDVGRAAELEQLRNAADVEIERTKREAAKENINLSMQLLQLDAAQREPLDRAYVLNRDEQRWQASYALQREAAARARAAADEEKLADDAMLQMVAAAKDYARNVAGDETTASVLDRVTTGAQLRALKATGGPLYERFGAYLENAAASQFVPGNKSLGRSPVQAITNVRALRLPTSKGEEALINTMAMAIEQEKIKPEWLALSTQEKAERAEMVAKQAASTLPVMTPEHLMVLEQGGNDPLTKYPLGQIAGVKNDPEAYKSFENLAAAAKNAVASKELGLVQAAEDLTRWAARARIHTNIGANFEGMGMEAPRFVYVQLPGSRKLTNITDPAAVTEWLIANTRPTKLVERYWEDLRTPEQLQAAVNNKRN